MAATYDISSHGLLSPHAKLMASTEASAFDALVEAAENLLLVHDTAFTGDDLSQVKYALVRQTNYLLEVTPDTQLAKMVRRGSRATQYKDGAPGLIDAVARSVVGSLGIALGGSNSFAVVRALR